MARTVLCAPSALMSQGRLRLLQPAVRVAQHDPHRVRVGGEHVLRQPNELDAALDPDPLLLDRRAQDTLGLGLRNEPEIVIAAVDPREVEAKDTLGSAIETGGKAGVAKPDHLVRQAAQLEQLQRARLHPDGSGRRRGSGLHVDDADDDAQAGQF